MQGDDMQGDDMQGDDMQGDDMQGDSILKEQFITLITDINAQHLHRLREITEKILYNSFCVFETTNLYLLLLYRLIFHTYKQNPLASFHILTGFIKFGQSEGGNTYKPLIDYFVIEAFNILNKENGWVVIKPCVTALREINYINEPLFQHILGCIVKQLDKDINETPYCSDLCYNLPREKSFTWGWFSYDIAKAYYAILFYKKEISAKQLRNIMMLYRKLLTNLRKNVLDIVRIANEPTVKIEENWKSILNVLNEYKWASDIIDKTLNDEESASEVAANANEVAHNEVAANKVAANASEVAASESDEWAEPLEAKDGVEGAELLEAKDGVKWAELLEAKDGVKGAEPLEAKDGVKGAEPLEAKEGVEGEEPLREKNNSWLYKLFGW